MGKLIVIEGTDGSGKSTQFKKLTDRLSCFSTIIRPATTKNKGRVLEFL